MNKKSPTKSPKSGENEVCNLMAEENKTTDKPERSGNKIYFEQYWRYCSSLRNWFVAYGIGGCVLFLSDKARMFGQVSPKSKVVILIAFIIGVVSQIVLAFINKIIHWYIYWGSEDEEFAKTWRYKVSGYLSECFWIDILADVITFFAFGVATVMLFITLGKG